MHLELVALIRRHLDLIEPRTSKLDDIMDPIRRTLEVARVARVARVTQESTEHDSMSLGTLGAR